MELREYKANNNVVDSSKYAVVWCPKYRRQVLEGKIASRHRHILVESCLYYRAKIIALETMLDHVYLVVEVEPQFGIHRLVKNLKRPFLALAEKGISCLEVQTAHALDKFILYFNGRGEHHDES